MGDYPQHERLSEVKEHSQAIGEFVDYSPYHLCELLCRDHGLDQCGECEDNLYEPYRFTLVRKPIQHILAEWFGIDYDALMEEKDEMVRSIRAAHE